MNYEEIVKWLRAKKVETGSLLCLGCGHEHNCGICGCAVMRAAADAMENLQTENASLHQIAEKQAVMNVNLSNKVLGYVGKGGEGCGYVTDGQAGT